MRVCVIHRRPLPIRIGNRIATGSSNTIQAPFGGITEEPTGAFPVMVKDVEMLPFPLSAALAGVKLHVIPMGSPLQENFTLPFIPHFESTLSVIGADVES